MNNNDILPILLSEREYHTNHPAEVRTQFIYTLGGTLTTVIAGLLFKDKIPALELITGTYCFWTAIVLIIIGYTLLFWTIIEHDRIHKRQRLRLETAIDYLLAPDSSDEFDVFWSQFSETTFHGINRPSDPKVKLVMKEPDTRNWIRFHDTKMKAGALCIIFGAIILITLMIIYPKNTYHKKQDAKHPGGTEVSVLVAISRTFQAKLSRASGQDGLSSPFQQTTRILRSKNFQNGSIINLSQTDFCPGAIRALTQNISSK